MLRRTTRSLALPPEPLPWAADFTDFSSKQMDSATAAFRQSGMWVPGRTIALREVKVTATAVQPPQDPYNAYSGTVKLYDRPSSSLDVGDGFQGFANIYEVMKGRFPGLLINLVLTSSGQKYSVRLQGNVSFQASTEVMFLLDGVPVTPDAEGFADMQFVSPIDVARIDLIKDQQTSIYGSRGGNGVIAVYTKKSAGRRLAAEGVSTLVLRGFEPSADYRQPTTAKASDQNPTVFWKPDLTTDSKGVGAFSFYKPNSAANLRVVVEGVTASGQPIYISEELKTRDEK